MSGFVHVQRMLGLMRRLILIAGCLAAFAFPAQALAQSTLPAGPAGANQYVQPVSTAVGPTAVTPTAVTPTAAAPTTTTSALPFTGEDLLLVVLTALILTAVGFTLYRQARDR